jgi:hypothetical protein
MDKTKLGKALSGGPIAEKIVAKMKRRMRSKIVNIRKVIESRTTAEELHKTVVTQEELAGLDLAHAAYVYTQNQVCIRSRTTGWRTSVAFPATAGFDDYERHMKYGPSREYWNDFVVEAGRPSHSPRKPRIQSTLQARATSAGMSAPFPDHRRV